MGLTVVEHQQQSPGGDVMDKKKKRRSSNRRPNKHFSAALNGSVPFDLDGQHQAAPENFQNSNYPRVASPAKQHGLDSVNVGFTSLPPLYINEQGARLDPGMRTISRPCLTQNTLEHSVVLQDNVDLAIGCNKQKRFDPHWSLVAVKVALQRGDVFQAKLRVNAHNRLEAYCTIEGVPTDIFINGIPRQNRAVEGDLVAVKVDPPHLWSKMKGSAVPENSPSPTDEPGPQNVEVSQDWSGGKDPVDAGIGSLSIPKCLPVLANGLYDRGNNAMGRIPNQEVSETLNSVNANGNQHSRLEPSVEACSPGDNEVLDLAEKLRQAVVSSPCKRPTGTVVAIIEPSSRRDTIVGLLDAKWVLNRHDSFRNEISKNSTYRDYIHLIPIDPKLPKMIVPSISLPGDLKKRLDDGDASIETELVAVRIDNWAEESLYPEASVTHRFGRGGEMEARIEAILFENAICFSEFSRESLSCLPDESWTVPQAEVEIRKDIRNLCIFTIDPSTATDLDDALSVQRLVNGVYRVGVHIADVSYFVQPDTTLDTEAQHRSTSVYMLKRKLPMLPPLLSENLGSLIPGVDRLTFSIFWDVDVSGNILDRWVGRTVIRSCCKLSYEHAQKIIDGQISESDLDIIGNGFPQLHGNFGWHDIFQSVRSLHEISKTLKELRFKSGALRLDNAKTVFLLDEFGDPYDCTFSDRKDSNFLVEEFMLLANRTAAEIISRAFPNSALLRRHPEPNTRKLKEFEQFCRKHGLDLDASSSASMHRSLEKIREKLKDDSVFYDILMNYATKPMQLAKYFCSGDVTVGEDEWGHYALAVPLYTHFTSPLRRYPDIVVHRTLTAALEAEQEYMKHQAKLNKANYARDDRCFTGMSFSKFASQSVEGLKALSSAAEKHKLLCTETLSDVASYCNQKKMASRQVKDAVDRLYMWALLKNKGILFSEARVLGVGPRFMSIYVQKLAIERRIYYDEVDGLIAEWLEATSTLVLHLLHHKRHQRRGNPGKFRPLEEMALMGDPSITEPESDGMQNGDFGESSLALDTMSQANVRIDPSVFPLTIRVLSSIPVALHAVGGDDGPLDIAARLYVASYFG